MGVSAKDVKELRDRTSAPMMECRAALEASGGDVEAAIKVLRERGIAKAAKRADRTTAEGLVRIAIGDGHQGGVAVMVTCETDFTARNDAFVQLADAALEAARSAGGGGVDEALKAPISTGGTLGQLLDDTKTKIHENMALQSVTRFDGTCGSYVHFDGKSGALVEARLSGGSAADAAPLLRDLAMHVVAAVPRPVAVAASAIPQDLIDQEREIFIKQAVDSGKPPEIAEKMVAGRMKKFTAERALLEQPFIKDPATPVKKLVDDAAKKLGADIEIVRFERLQVGGE